jgi:enoyl-CoA hydratase/carnithine racemase
MATEEIVLTEEVEPGTVLVTMNRPDRLNAMSMDLITELHATFEHLEADRSVRAIVLTGAGRGFCAGLDLKAAGHGAPGTDSMAPIPRTFATQEHIASLNERIHRLRKPVIAAVNGPAVGGGFALALACDIRFAVPSASFGAVFITLGVSACDMGTSYFLPRLVGASRSAELLLTGRVFDAAEAVDIGLVLEVVESEALLERALLTARQIVAHSPLAVWMTKETMWQTLDAPSLRHAMDMENRTQVLCTATGDMVEATTAFREGRPARWNDL